MAFPNRVAVNPAIGIEGDFASTNPRQMLVPGGPNQRMVAGETCLAGRFGLLASDGTVSTAPGYAAASATGAATRIGFVHRYMGAALITVYRGESSMQIQPGMAVEPYAIGDFFARATAVTGTPVRGASVIWNPADGTLNIGATVSGTTIDTGFKLLSETAVAGGLVMIGKNGA